MGTKVPGNESSTYGTFVPGNESSLVRKFQLPLIWSVDSEENHGKGCHQRSDFMAKCTKFDFGWGSAPDPAGELTALSQTS